MTKLIKEPSEARSGSTVLITSSAVQPRLRGICADTRNKKGLPAVIQTMSDRIDRLSLLSHREVE